MLLASKQTQLIEEVRALISSKLISADSQSNRLKGLLDDVVRPVSHRLFREFESVLQEPKVAEVKGFDWMILFREAMYSRTTYPLAFGVWLGRCTSQLAPHHVSDCEVNDLVLAQPFAGHNVLKGERVNAVGVAQVRALKKECLVCFSVQVHFISPVVW